MGSTAIRFLSGGVYICQ